MTPKGSLIDVTHPGSLNLSGSTPESKDRLEILLQKDRQQHHCFFKPNGFHNHTNHHLFAAFDLGAPAKTLQAIYDAEEPMQRPIDLTGERKGFVINKDNWKEFLGQQSYYASYLTFFTGEVAANGAANTLETYVLAGSDSADGENVDMLSRFYSGAFHNVIQLGYGAEFGSDATIAQALAQTAMHSSDTSLFQTLKKPKQPTHSQSPSSRLTLFEILRQVYDSTILHPVMPYDPNALLSKRISAVLTDGRPEEIIRICAQWWHPTTDPDPADLAKKAEEFLWVATLLLAATGKPDRKPRLDFFLMHIVNLSIFLPSLMKIISKHELKIRLLDGLLPVVILYLLIRGRPRIDPKLVMTYTATPRPPLDRATLPSPDSSAIGDPQDAQCVNPWPAIVEGVLYAPDCHAVKLVRALYYGAQQYGLTRCGEVPGAFRDMEGRKVETHEGLGKVDGTVFVRAAGLAMDTLGWVSWGDKEGEWDRSALGWDDAWKGED